MDDPTFCRAESGLAVPTALLDWKRDPEKLSS
jgi:hypothetical protein